VRQVNDVAIKSNAKLLACNTGDLCLFTKHAKQPEPDHVLYGLEVKHENSHHSDRNFTRKQRLFHTQKKKIIKQYGKQEEKLEMMQLISCNSRHALAPVAFSVLVTTPMRTHFACFH